jgi:hypothetical protein
MADEPEAAEAPQEASHGEQTAEQEAQNKFLRCLARLGQGAAIAIVVLVMLACLAAAVYAVIEIYPHKVRIPTNPSFVDNIFDSRVVILAARIVLLFAAAYVAISVVALVAGRRWLAQIGPFRASEPLKQLDKTAEQLEAELKDARDTIRDLRNRLSVSDKNLENARKNIASLLDDADKMDVERN